MYQVVTNVVNIMVYVWNKKLLIDIFQVVFNISGGLVKQT